MSALGPIAAGPGDSSWRAQPPIMIRAEGINR